MIPEFLNNSEFFSSHWGFVIGISLAFFVVQVVLSLRLYLRARQHDRILVRMRRDFEQGGDGREDVRRLPNNFPWIHWVLSIFPAGETAVPGNYTRDEVLQELDTRIASRLDYLLLQRMGVMAPLLGVFLTVVGFYWLEVDETGEQSLQSILRAVTPLVSGVGAGAVLALINQILLHCAGGRIESLRMSARTWFDEVIWSNIGLDSKAATAKTATAIQRFTRSVGDAADRHAASSDRMENSTATMLSAASQFQDAIHSFNNEIKGIPQTLCDLRAAIAASADALRELIPVGSRAVANLDVSVAAFRTTVDREFTGAAKLHHRSSESLAESVRHIGESTESLKAGSDELKRTAQSSASSFARLDDSLRQHVVPGNHQFHDAVQSLTGKTASLNKVIGTLSDHVEAVAVEFDRMFGRLTPSVSAFCDAVDHRFSLAVTQHGKGVESVGLSVQQLRDAAKNMSEGTNALNATLRECASLVGHAGSNYEALSSTVKGPADVRKQLPQTIQSDVVEQSAGDDAELEDTRGGLRTWIGRPR